MKKMGRHPHPITILHNLKRFFWVLVIPLARGFFSAVSGDSLKAWVEGAWIDLAVLSLMTLLATLQWLVCRYSSGRSGVHVTSGLILHTRTAIPAAAVATLCVVRPFYYKPFRAVKLRADTLAGTKKRADFSLIVSREEADRILRQRRDTFEDGSLTRQYRPHSLYVAALAAFTSSSFAGIVFMATLISQTGELLGNEFRDRVYGTLERFTQLLAFGIPPAAAALAYILLFGWLIAFATNFIRHKNLCVRRQGTSLAISGGIFTNRDYLVGVDKINFLDIRQSVLSWVLRFCSVHINAVGYSKYKDDVSGVVPAVRKRDVQKTLNMFFPEFRPAVGRQLKHNWGALFKFVGDAAWGCLLIPAATLLLRWLIAGWADFIGWVGFMLCFPAYWFLIVRLIDYFTSGISREGNCFTLHYSAGYFLHTVVIPLDKIAWVCLRQSPIQYFDGKCDLIIYSFSEESTRHHIRNIDRQGAKDMFAFNADGA